MRTLVLPLSPSMLPSMLPSTPPSVLSSLLPSVLSSLLYAVAAALAAPQSLAAQVPLDYLLVAESAKAGAVRYLEPATGVTTPVAARGTTPVLVAPASLALDPTDPFSIYHAGGAANTIAAVLNRAQVQGNRLLANTPVQLRGITGPPARLHVLGPDILATVTRGTGAGVHSAPLGGGNGMLLAALPNAHDLAVIGTKVYVSSYLAATPTTILEHDTMSKVTRTVGTSYPPLQAIAAYAGSLLLAGTDAGDLLLIDLTTGTAAPFLQPKQGAIVAVAVSPTSGAAYFATAANPTNAVWSAFAPTAPLYTTPVRITDLDVGVHAQASLLVFGQGCSGSSAAAPYMDPIGVPALGNASFVVRAAGAMPTRPAALVLGQSRTRFGAVPLPFDLVAIRMPGCFLYTDALITLGGVVDAAGVAQVPVPIPNQPFLTGGHLTGQLLVLDPQAVPLGLALSDGTEGIVR